MLEDLALVLVHLLGADPEPAVGEADGRIGEQRQHGRAVVGLVGRDAGHGMAGTGERGHSHLFHDLGLALLLVVAHGVAAGQHEEFGLLGQWCDLIRPWQAEFIASAAHEQQVRMVENLPVGRGEKHSRLRLLLGWHDRGILVFCTFGQEMIAEYNPTGTESADSGRGNRVFADPAAKEEKNPASQHLPFLRQNILPSKVHRASTGGLSCFSIRHRQLGCGRAGSHCLHYLFQLPAVITASYSRSG